jgi:type IV pilus assembly protein PilV
MQPQRQRQQGASMIEVLVTIVIIAFGLLGMAGLQSRLQVSEMEAYQRAQALVLLNEMAMRISTNRALARADVYVTANPIGADDYASGASTCDAKTVPGYVSTNSTYVQAKADVVEWCHALQGAAVTSGGNKAGAVIAGRGCVQALGNNEYLITVAWQGLVPVSAPLDTVTCGSGLYNIGGDTGCINEVCRRTVTTVIRVANLV